MLLLHSPQHGPSSAHPLPKRVDPLIGLRDLSEAQAASQLAHGQACCEVPLTPAEKRVDSVGLEDDNTRERNEKIRKASGGSPLETSTCGVEN